LLKIGQAKVQCLFMLLATSLTAFHGISAKRVHGFRYHLNKACSE